MPAALGAAGCFIKKGGLRMPVLLGLGELLVDFTPDGVNGQGMALFVRNPGGSIPNLLAMYQKMGGRAVFVGKVGRDSFGDFLVKQLEDVGVDIGHVLRHPRVPTTLAIVSLRDSGERAFHFYRKPGADILLEEKDLPLELISETPNFHFAGVSLTDEPARAATFKAARLASAAGAFISFDCNYRASLWDSEREARQVLLSALPLAHIVKLSEEELELLCPEGGEEEKVQAVLGLGVQALLVSRGEKGSGVYTRALRASRPAFKVAAVDTTGCGDAFLGALLYGLHSLGRPLDTLHAGDWQSLLDLGNAAGALTATGRGGIPALPGREAVEGLLKTCPS